MKLDVLVPKIVGLIVVSLLLAWCLHIYGAAQLAKIDSSDTAEYIAHKRHIYHLSFGFSAFGIFLLSALYVGAVDIVSHVVRRLFFKRPAA